LRRLNPFQRGVWAVVGPLVIMPLAELGGHTLEYAVSAFGAVLLVLSVALSQKPVPVKA
jgi:hypothetical protein